MYDVAHKRKDGSFVTEEAKQKSVSIIVFDRNDKFG